MLKIHNICFKILLVVYKLQQKCTKTYSRSINVCVPLIVQILQVPQIHKLLWLQTVSGLLRNLVELQLAVIRVLGFLGG